MCRSPWLPPPEDGGHARQFGVIRHTERGDSPFATVGGVRWTQTEDYIRWPFDPPLSDEGLVTAHQLACDVSECYQGRLSRVDVVVTSPYLRCIQTAGAICDKLGPNVRLVIDNSIGEIYGPSVMGIAEPVRTARPLEELPSPRLRHLTSLSKVVGDWPVWPEDQKVARRRFASRFLWYLRWACKARKNFLLVTHADSVGAALRVLPSHAGQMVESIDYGGMFMVSLARDFFHRACHEMSTPKSAKEHLSKDSSFGESGSSPDWVEKWKARLAWRVRTDGIILKRTGVRPGAALTKRLGSLAEDCSPARELVKLLQKLPGAPSSFTPKSDEFGEEVTPCLCTGRDLSIIAPGSLAESSSATKELVLHEIGRSVLLKRRRDMRAHRASEGG